MTTARSSLIARDDTLLGVCAGLGEDLGFNPLPLRMAFAVLLLWNPVVVLSVYVGLGLLVFASRMLFPIAKPAPMAAEAPEALQHENDDVAMAAAA